MRQYNYSREERSKGFLAGAFQIPTLWEILLNNELLWTSSTEAGNEEGNMESKEIIEDQLVSIISKDYLDVFSK